jgi:hypothetical protein
MGVNVVRTRTIVFGLAASLAAIGGGMLAMNDRVVTTDQFDLFRSLALYTAIVFGGAELLSGAVVGAVLLLAVPYVNARQGWKISPNLIFGLLVLAGTAAFPDGVTPTFARWLRRVVRVVDKDVTDDGAVIGARGPGPPRRAVTTDAPVASDGAADAPGAVVSARRGPDEAPRAPESSTPTPQGSA